MFKENSKRNFDKQAENYDDGRNGKFVKIMYQEIINRINLNKYELLINFYNSI
ncbi:conserved domain protein [Clostridium botulinum F str. 230613]|uniref:Conserved domain protein n=1 Tax=Clostridium botulinum (strain Langeland / NCTC 10281 / Type F) TaxID=441772 RepID=A7GAX0_CLOBL|nr:conserved domain protein [Clostridium botulinum F str. Langeland]ADF98390.1 conserved domain protein [Clostridium botulinum F str. 230613]